jgi:protein phosphatase
MTAYEHAARATVGARDYQEDNAAVWAGGAGSALADAGPSAKSTVPIVAVLADGMGGHVGGSLASRIVCDTFLAAYGKEAGAAPERMLAALDAANAAIAAKVAANPMLSGMGSTLVGAVFDADGLQWVSVGDSPMFLYRRGEVALLNEDHSLAPELDNLAAAGRITAEEARNDPRRHMLRSAVTGDELDLVDLPRRPLALEPGDYVILASDGLQTLERSEIERIISAYGGDGADAVARALIRAIELIRDPHQDNATVIAVRALPPPSA